MVVASRGGDDVNPAWFLNLKDDPRVKVKLGPKPAESMIAQIAAPMSGTVVAHHRRQARQLRRLSARRTARFLSFCSDLRR